MRNKKIKFTLNFVKSSQKHTLFFYTLFLQSICLKTCIFHCFLVFSLSLPIGKNKGWINWLCPFEYAQGELQMKFTSSRNWIWQFRVAANASMNNSFSNIRISITTWTYYKDFIIYLFLFNFIFSFLLQTAFHTWL